MNAAQPPRDFVPDGYNVPAWRVLMDFEEILADAARKGRIAEWQALVERARTVRVAAARDQDAIRRVIAECEKKLIGLRDWRILQLEHHLTEMIAVAAASIPDGDQSYGLRKKVEHATICLGDRL